MTSYRRNFLAGGCFFFTVNLADRRLRLLTAHIGLLRQALRYVRQRHPFAIDAIVVLSDHLHAIWTLPEDDADFATRRAPHQIRIFAWPAGQRTHFTESRRQTRARYLAAAVLGAYVA